VGQVSPQSREQPVQVGDEIVRGDRRHALEELFDLQPQLVDRLGETEKLGHCDVGAPAEQRKRRREVADLREVAQEGHQAVQSRDQLFRRIIGHAAEVDVGVNEVLDVVRADAAEEGRAAIGSLGVNRQRAA
jgi:hypothetical protein